MSSASKKKHFSSFHLRRHGHTKQYSVFELLHDSGHDTNISFLVYIRSREVNWSRSESYWYICALDTILVSCIEASVKLGRELPHNGALLAYFDVPEAPMIFWLWRCPSQRRGGKCIDFWRCSIDLLMRTIQ